MKTIKISILISMVFIFSSCSLTVDVDDDDELGKITASAMGDNSDGSVSIGGFLDVDVVVFDRDGIASIRLEIPAIEVDYVTNINSGNTTEKINQTFRINQIDSNESKTIFVTMRDKEGNSYTKTLAFVTE